MSNNNSNSVVEILRNRQVNQSTGITTASTDQWFESIEQWLTQSKLEQLLYETVLLSIATEKESIKLLQCYNHTINDWQGLMVDCPALFQHRHAISQYTYKHADLSLGLVQSSLVEYTLQKNSRLNGCTLALNPTVVFPHDTCALSSTRHTHKGIVKGWTVLLKWTSRLEQELVDQDKRCIDELQQWWSRLPQQLEQDGRWTKVFQQLYSQIVNDPQCNTTEFWLGCMPDLMHNCWSSALQKHAFRLIDNVEQPFTIDSTHVQIKPFNGSLVKLMTNGLVLVIPTTSNPNDGQQIEPQIEQKQDEQEDETAVDTLVNLYQVIPGYRALYDLDVFQHTRLIEHLDSMLKDALNQFAPDQMINKSRDYVGPFIKTTTDQDD